MTFSDNTSVNPFGEWLRDQYLQWQSTQNQNVTAGDFARYLQTSSANISRWMSGKVLPRGERLDHIAKTLGPEVYDLLGLIRPDQRLRLVVNRWGQLNDQQQQVLIDQIFQMLACGH